MKLPMFIERDISEIEHRRIRRQLSILKGIALLLLLFASFLLGHDWGYQRGKVEGKAAADMPYIPLP